MEQTGPEKDVRYYKKKERQDKVHGDHVIACLVSELGKNRKNIGSLS